MLDIKMIRQNMELVEQKLTARGVAPEVLTHFLTLDEKRRELLVQTEELKKYRNDVSGAIATLKREKVDATDKITEMKAVGEQIKDLDTHLQAIDDELQAIATTLPNLAHDSVPVGKDEEDNIEVRRWGTPGELDFAAKPHWEIAEDLGILD
ncbi:MAG: serine--tRNA ligase, partial [Enterococcus aquimarinus]